MPKRRYTAHQKLAAVAEAEVNGVQQASDKLGIAESTIRYWIDDPAFAEIRAKTREELAAGFKALAHLAQDRLARTINDMEPRDLTILLGVATDKHLLMSGDATSRIESVSITDGLDDHEREVLSTVIRAELARRSESPAASPAVGDPVAAGAESTER